MWRYRITDDLKHEAFTETFYELAIGFHQDKVNSVNITVKSNNIGHAISSKRATGSGTPAGLGTRLLTNQIDYIHQN